jgi:hypothetical protein
MMIVRSDQTQYGKQGITDHALERLDAREAKYLTDIVAWNRESFIANGHAYNTLAVPVAVNWTSPMGRRAIRSGLIEDRANGRSIGRLAMLNLGRTSHLDELSEVIAHHTGAKSVHFGNKLYVAAKLRQAKSSDLHDHVLAMMSSPIQARTPPEQVVIQSLSERMWGMVYLLGAEVTEVGGTRRLNDGVVQDALKSWITLAEKAITNSLTGSDFVSGDPVVIDPVSMNPVADIDANLDADMYADDQARIHGGIQIECQGVWYLNEALHQGEISLRRYQLRAVLQAVGQAGGLPHIRYAYDSLDKSIRMLVFNSEFTYPLRWPEFPGDTLQSFLAELRGLIATLFNVDPSGTIEHLSWTQFEKALKASPAGWVTRIKPSSRI